MMRSVDVELDDILDVVACAESYGFAREVLFDALADWAGWVSDEEIAVFVGRYTTPEYVAKGYGEEDAKEVRKHLTDWRNRFCKKEGS